MWLRALANGAVHKITVRENGEKGLSGAAAIQFLFKQASCCVFLGSGGNIHMIKER